MAARTIAGICCFILLGCDKIQPPTAVQPAGPSYAEALTVYNQELDLLDRLTKKAAAAEAEYEQKVARSKGTVALEDAVQDLSRLTELANAGTLPALDEEGAAKVKESSEKARAQLAELGAKTKIDLEAAETEHAAEMGRLKLAIEEQEAKVAQAKQVKDEAEKRR